VGTPLLWIVFNLLVLFLLALDLSIFHRRPRAVSFREAAAWSVFWVVVSLGFNLWIWRHYGSGPGLEFLTGYVIEKSLSVDNLFVFAMLFRYFAVEPRYEHRVLYWGILGAIVLRGVMIVAGVALIQHFAWVLYLFGAFIVYAGLKMLLRKDKAIHPEKNLVVRWVQKHLPLTKEYANERFFVRREGAWRATPLFLALLVLEAADLAFAVDSIPAIFAITRDPFIVYSSNVCAILGLRALYFLLAGALRYLRYLDVGLGAVLIFVGGKMLGEHCVTIPTHVSLLIVGAMLAVSVMASLLSTRPQTRSHRDGEGKARNTFRSDTEGRIG
jgi:tellurite resistance protein TerC